MNKDEIIGIKKATDFSGVTARGLRFACAAGHIPGAQKVGRDWVMTLEALDYYVNYRPKRGRKPRDGVQKMQGRR